MDARAAPPPPKDRAPDAQERFRALYLAHAERVYRYCLRRLGFNRAAAEDATAEVFVVVWRRLPAVPPPPSDRAFVYAVARRQVSNQQRGIRRLLGLKRRISVQPPEPSGTDADTTSVRRHRLRGALEELPSGQREALILVVLEGLSHAEAAQVLGCSENAVAVRLHKARMLLRDRVMESATPMDSREPTRTSGGEGARRWK
jgi:RNA polymerase sigma-70 factor (ECF subfamily)